MQKMYMELEAANERERLIFGEDYNPDAYGGGIRSFDHLTIAAAKIGATIYLFGRDGATDKLLNHAASCAMCRRMIINAGIDTIIARDGPDKYISTPVETWILNDDSLFRQQLV